MCEQAAGDWPVNDLCGPVSASVGARYLHMLLSDGMSPLLVCFHTNFKVKWRLSVSIETLCELRVSRRHMASFPGHWEALVIA